MIHGLKRPGLLISAITRKLGLDRKTVRKHLEAGVVAPLYGPLGPPPRQIAPFEPYLRERIPAFPYLSGRRLLREIRGMRYVGGYTAVIDYLRAILGFKQRWERNGEKNRARFAKGGRKSVAVRGDPQSARRLDARRRQ